MEREKDLDIRVIYSDIDGTLLNDSHHIPFRTREKILELDRQGIWFILVSARMPAGVRLIQRELGNQRPIVCYSGGLILDEEQRVMYSCQIEPGLAAQVLALVEKECPGVCPNMYGKDLWVVKDDKNPWVAEEERITEGKALVGDMETVFAEAGGIHKFLFMGNPKDIEEAQTLLRETFPSLSVLRSKDTYLEVMNKKVSKAEGVRFLCDRYHIPLSQAAAFGDGDNDLGMIHAVGYGYAMGNAPKEVRQQAKRVTLSNEEEGIWQVIKDIH